MSLSAKAKRRLTKLADGLAQKVKPAWFRLNVWAEEGWPEKTCGTAACAVGWATALVPECGIVLKRSAGLLLPYVPVLKSSPRCGAKKLWRESFDIDEDQADFLFFPNSNYITKAHVVRRIRKFVKCGGVIK